MSRCFELSQFLALRVICGKTKQLKTMQKLKGYTMISLKNRTLVCLVRFFTSHQQFFSNKETDLRGLNPSLARINVLAQGHSTVTPWRLEPRPLGLESITLPLSYCAPNRTLLKLKKVE